MWLSWLPMRQMVVLVVVLGLVSSHYTMHDYNVIAQTTQRATSADCNDYPQLMSYHIHVMFWPKDPTSVASALALRNEFITRFEIFNMNCTINPGDPAPNKEDMCVFPIDWDQGLTPFPTAQFSFFIPPKHHMEATTYILQHRGEHDVYIHPNSGCEIYDHLRWGVWAGRTWPLDVSILDCHYPGCVPDH